MIDILNKLWRQFKRFGLSLRWNVEQKIVPAVGCVLVGTFVTYIVNLNTIADLSTYIQALVFTIGAVLSYPFNSRVLKFVDLFRLWKCAWSDVNSFRELAMHSNNLDRRQLALEYLIVSHDYSYQCHVLFTSNGMDVPFTLYEKLIEATAKRLDRSAGKRSFSISASSLVSPMEVLKRPFYMEAWSDLYKNVGWESGQAYRILIPVTSKCLIKIIDTDEKEFRKYLKWHVQTGFEIFIYRHGKSTFEASEPMLSLYDFAVFGDLAVLGVENVKDDWTSSFLKPNEENEKRNDEKRNENKDEDVMQLSRQLIKVGIQYDTKQYKDVLEELKTNKQYCKKVDLSACDMGIAEIKNFLSSA